MALERDDIELVAVNDPFISTDYMVSYFLSVLVRQEWFQLPWSRFISIDLTGYMASVL